MFGDSCRKLRASYQAEDPSQAEEVCMDDSNQRRSTLCQPRPFGEAGQAVYRTLIEQLFLHARNYNDPSYHCPGERPFLTLLSIVGGWRQIWRARLPSS
jgi:hypothetical protein